MDPGVIPRLVAIDERAGAPWLVPNVQSRAAPVEGDGPPTVERDGRTAAIVELAFDDNPALMRDEPRGRQRRPGLPVEGEAILVGKRTAGARIPLAVQLDGAGGVRNQRAIAGEDGERTGLLVGERL